MASEDGTFRTSAALAFVGDDARRVAQALARKPVVTLDEVCAETGFERTEARAILRDFTRAGLVTTQLATSGGCCGRRDKPQFFFSLTPAGRDALAAVVHAEAAG